MSTADFQPTLVGKTVIVRPVQPGDWPAMFKAASDPLIWELHPAKDRYTEPVFKAFFDAALASKMAFAFLDRATGEIIGSSRYHNHDAALGEIEIGWTFLTRAYWGGRTNLEIKRLMIDHAFTFVETVVFWVGETNWRSQRAMEKIGGVRRSGVHVRAANGTDHQHVVFEIKKPHAPLPLQ
jgi:RimJ/RimL family protein N-acetyltransferase